jgi:hypothetical protein
MVEQANIIEEVTRLFAEKFKAVAKVKVNDMSIGSMDESPVVTITLLGIEQTVERNMQEKIKLQGRDEQGNAIEYFVEPPSLFQLTFMVTPTYKSYHDSLKVIGLLARAVKDNNQIPIGEYDWHGNEGRPVYISSYPGFGLEKQIQFCNMIGQEYRPSLFYSMTIGINSANKEIFRRVKERKISAIRHEN